MLSMALEVNGMWDALKITFLKKQPQLLIVCTSLAAALSGSPFLLHPPASICRPRPG